MNGVRPAFGPGVRRNLAAWVAVAAIVVLAVWLVARNGADDPRTSAGVRAEVGKLYTSFGNSNPRDFVGTTEVRVPTGAARVSVYADTLDAGDGEDVVRAPSGGRLVTVEASPQAPATGLAALLGNARSYGEQPAYTLVADGHRYRLSTSTSSTPATFGAADSVVAAVSGHPRHYVLEVTFGAVTQSVDLSSGTRTTGRAAPLYSAPAVTSVPCGTPSADDVTLAVSGSAPATCRVQVSAVPWAPGRGWAPSGTSFVVLSVRPTPPQLVRSTRSDTVYAPLQFGASTIVVDGGTTPTGWSAVAGTAVASGGVGGVGVSSFVRPAPVVRGAAIAVRVELTFSAEHAGAVADEAQREITVHLTWSTTLVAR